MRNCFYTKLESASVQFPYASILGKLCSRWFGLYTIHTIFSHMSIEIEDLKNSVTFIVNDKRLKSYLECQSYEEDTEIDLSDLPNFN